MNLTKKTDDIRDLSKIKIDSEKFIRYLENLPEEKRSQLIQLASEVKIGGHSQGLVSKPPNNQRVMNHLNIMGRVSGMTMHGMMAKNVLADFLNGKGVAGFIVGGQGFANVIDIKSEANRVTEIIIYNFYVDNSIDTIDLRNLVKNKPSNFELQVTKSGNYKINFKNHKLRE